MQKRRPKNASRTIAICFAAIIILGTVLLLLPFSSRDGSSCGVVTALFTSTSATCVTGLILRDTWTQWSGFGQTVILCLIEIGGLGFMTAASLLIFGLRKKVNMDGRMLMAQLIGSEDIGDSVRMQKRVLLGCLSVQLAGAAILTVRFSFKYGFLSAVKLGVFHSVSAFCNAGFDIFGFEREGVSLGLYHTDAVVSLTISALIIIGGIGFLVWDEIFRVRSFRKLSVYSKLVLLTTAVLLLCGAVLYLVFEWNNTLANLPFGEKLLAAFFQSSTVRTAGFAGIDQGALSYPSKALTVLLMLIGGSSGSTAGGLKTVTFVVLILFLRSRIKGEERPHIFSRSIRLHDVLNALTIFGIMVGLAFFGSIVLCASSGVSLTNAVYECVSALATVGLTTGITPSLSIIAHLLLIFFMYFGRVGILTVSLGFLRDKKAQSKYEYAKTSLIIG